MAKRIDKKLPVTGADKLQGFLDDSLFRKLIENSYSGVSLLNKDLQIIYRSPSAERIGGWNLNDRLENTFYELTYPSDRQMVKEAMEKVFSSPAVPVTCTFRSKHYKGYYIWLECTFDNMLHDTDINAIVCNFRDVTGQKNAEEHLQQVERDTILESIADAFFAVDKNWTVTYWNKTAEKVLSKTKEEILNKNLWEVFSDSINSKSYVKYHEAIETQKAVHFEDYYEPLKKWYEISAYPSPTSLSVYFKDITDRKSSEILLIASEKKYSELFNLSPLPMWVFDQSSLKFLDVNMAAIKNYGFTRDEFLSMSVMDIRPEEDIAALQQALHSAKKKHHFMHHGIYRHKKKNGEIIQVDILSNTLSYRGKNAKVVIANDVTQRLKYIKAIEEQNEKLHEISWIQSHIVRAPLSRIMGLVPLINDAKNVSPETATMLQYLLASANELDEAIKSITDKTTKADYNI
ncbi:PAS domain S-box protein [Mucilaginibacter sp.]|uniref:PAS domain-containing protein n=1 Tax=Mucilaginibacter sp. TaxID=1882438 RepID=UPI0026265A0B|nr:PAS domain S-box protein [Mucilaginibacter sp.]MDB5129734.1 domain S-box-containing protein [Mucilaginibacter sp.]